MFYPHGTSIKEEGTNPSKYCLLQTTCCYVAEDYTAQARVLHEKKTGLVPYRLWIDSLRDTRTKNRIDQRVRRMELGLFGDHRHLGDGVYELRLFFGSGYRVYFAEDGNTVILLLLGGDKSTQRIDIVQAKQYWKDYKERST